MNKLNFKTYEEFVEDGKYELLDDLTDVEKLDLYNRYCEYNDDYDSMIYPNDSEFLETMFGTNVDAVARAIAYGDYKYTDEYIKFDGYGNLQTYCDAYDALEDNFIDSEIVDFITKDRDVDTTFKDSYVEYIENILDEAYTSMSPEDFSDILKEYTTEEMQEKYPEVFDAIDYNYSDDILDENDRNESKNTENSLER